MRERETFLHPDVLGVDVDFGFVDDGSRFSFTSKQILNGPCDDGMCLFNLMSTTFEINLDSNPGANDETSLGGTS